MTEKQKENMIKSIKEWTLPTLIYSYCKLINFRRYIYNHKKVTDYSIYKETLKNIKAELKAYKDELYTRGYIVNKQGEFIKL